MSGESLTDFYQGWVIELVIEEEGYRCICYSISRKRLHLRQIYTEEFEATKAAKQMISRYEACSQLGRLVRDLYERERVSLEEWRLLNSSLFSWVLD